MPELSFTYTAMTHPMNAKLTPVVKPSAFNVEAWYIAAGNSASAAKIHFPYGTARIATYAPAM
ncbi:MAG: hypothetical protein MZV64_00375 [Ignavibacteriales bacterium]|nr:hypothetical protein [Ignavibacteriales bacterium]